MPDPQQARGTPIWLTGSSSTGFRTFIPTTVAIVDGLPVTSVARTLVDLAQDMAKDELRSVFMRAAELGLLDLDAVRACAGRVEWRPSLAMVHEVIEEFAR